MSEKTKPVAKLVAVDKQSKAKLPLVAIWDNGGRLSFSLEKGVRIKAGEVEVTLGKAGEHYGNAYINVRLEPTSAPAGGGPGPAVDSPVDDFSDDPIPFLVDETTRDGAP